MDSQFDTTPLVPTQFSGVRLLDLKNKSRDIDLEIKSVILNI
jgi:hypothetical protein